ncbi:MBOAT family O-acyltransferase [Coleofasciculus sp. F4-SAH-05]|uniref:MBOAT family O-acyltransferase n=1 Tax=Coleofasciculus sp. F4-SAH-05 TaxID=3069525 RepID=UPI0032F5B2EB
MIFNSVEFFIFLAVTYLLYRILPFRGQNLMLLVASYVFYGWWDERFLFLIVLSTVIDFCCGLMIDKGELTRRERWFPSGYILLAAFFFVTVRWNGIELTTQPLALSGQWSQLLPRDGSGWLVFLGMGGVVALANFFYPRLAALEVAKRRSLFLFISLFSNLGILGFFKYFNFFIDSAETTIQTLGMSAAFWHLDIVLPVGISFYTFQTMSYTIDIYRRQMPATNRFLDFALFVSFFPQLVAGPIERASKLLPCLLQPRQLSLDQSTRGVYLILFGLFKKVAVADSLAVSVNAIYETQGTVSWLDVVLATFLFAGQIYGDFSGYSDIARGVSKLFGVELMVNFNLPYFAQNPSEFWRRWHISLSTWLRDYLYIPLGGNRHSERRTYQNLMTTMVLGGLWHGAAWHFVLWGFYHGALLCVHRVFTTTFKRQPKVKKNQGFVGSFVAILFFFVFTCYGWLLFRANSLAQVISFTQILILDFGNLALSIPKPTFSGLLGLPLLMSYEVIEYYAGHQYFYRRSPAMMRGLLYAILTILIVMGTSNEPAQFIYFQF